MQTPNAKARYERMASVRAPYLERARQCAEFTLPTLLPQEGSNGYTNFKDQFQNSGTRGVNNLTSRLLLVLFPPSMPFFHYTLQPKIAQQLDPEKSRTFYEALGNYENTILTELETRGLRVHAHLAIQHVIVTGNGLLHVEDGGMRFFPLSQYVVRRNRYGGVVEIVLKEVAIFDTLEPEIQEAIRAKMDLEDSGPHDERPDEERPVDIYTHVYLDGEKYSVYQEALGIELPKTRGTYRKDALPWIALRGTAVTGEDYGRSKVDENLGDLTTLEGLMKDIVECTATAAKTVLFVDPASGIMPKELEDAENGEVLAGNAQHVTAFRVEKNADMTLASNVTQEIKRELARDYLQNTSIQRQGERVTAEEIRLMASELEQGLGGLYTLLANEFQMPLVKIIENDLRRQRVIARELTKEQVKLTITTGFDALGRNAALARLDQFVQGSVKELGPAVLQYIDVTAYLRERALNTGLQADKILKDPKVITQEREAANANALAQKAAGPAINAMSQMSPEAAQQMMSGAAGGAGVATNAT